MFVIKCNKKEKSFCAWSNAIEYAREISRNEFDRAKIYNDGDDSDNTVFAEFYCGFRVDQKDTDPRVFQIGWKMIKIIIVFLLFISGCQTENYIFVDPFCPEYIIEEVEKTAKEISRLCDNKYMIEFSGTTNDMENYDVVKCVYEDKGSRVGTSDVTGDIYLFIPGTNERNVEYVIKHEIGHYLGSEHLDSGNIMFGWNTGLTEYTKEDLKNICW